jgi:hypothetical protein
MRYYILKKRRGSATWENWGPSFASVSDAEMYLLARGGGDAIYRILSSVGLYELRVPEVKLSLHQIPEE